MLDFYNRLPFGDAEKSRKAIRDFLTIRRLNLKLKNQVDDLLPLTQAPTKVRLADILDLRKSKCSLSLLFGICDSVFLQKKLTWLFAR